MVRPGAPREEGGDRGVSAQGGAAVPEPGPSEATPRGSPRKDWVAWRIFRTTFRRHAPTVLLSVDVPHGTHRRRPPRALGEFRWYGSRFREFLRELQKGVQRRMVQLCPTPPTLLSVCRFVAFSSVQRGRLSQFQGPEVFRASVPDPSTMWRVHTLCKVHPNTSKPQSLDPYFKIGLAEACRPCVLHCYTKYRNQSYRDTAPLSVDCPRSPRNSSMVK